MRDGRPKQKGYDWRSSSLKDLRRQCRVAEAGTGAATTALGVLTKAPSSSQNLGGMEIITQQGDWLYDIGRRHNVNVKSLLRANPQINNPELIPVGHRIVIPHSAAAARHLSPPRGRSPTRAGRYPAFASATTSSLGVGPPRSSSSRHPGGHLPPPPRLPLPPPLSPPNQGRGPSPSPSPKGSGGTSRRQQHSPSSPPPSRTRGGMVGRAGDGHPQGARALAAAPRALVDQRKRASLRAGRPCTPRVTGVAASCDGSSSTGGAGPRDMLSGLAAALLPPVARAGLWLRRSHLARVLVGSPGGPVHTAAPLRPKPAGRRAPQGLRKASYGERAAALTGPPPPLAGGAALLGRRATWQRRVARGKSWEVPHSRITTVKVEFGDNLADIARRCSQSVEELQRLNNMNDDFIVEGDRLVVVEGPLRQDPPQLRPGIRRTLRPLFSRHVAGPGGGGAAASCCAAVAPWGGAAGATTAGGLAAAAARTRRALPEGRWKSQPKGVRKAGDTWLRLVSPVTHGYVSSPFGPRWGKFHEGIDVAAEPGTPILAADRGVVTHAGWNGGYGQLVAIQHEGGFVTRYAHCMHIMAQPGQHVARGQRVAAVGETGAANGPHLHFEVRRNGSALDPAQFVSI